MDFTPLAVAATIVTYGMAFFKHMVNKQYREAMTLVAAFVMGTAVGFLLRASDFAGGIDLGDITLADVNVASTLLVGVAIAALARALIIQPIKAIDQNQSAAEPKLFPPTT